MCKAAVREAPFLIQIRRFCPASFFSLRAALKCDTYVSEIIIYICICLQQAFCL